MRICVPVQAVTNVITRAIMEKALDVADMIELRVDGMKDPDLSELLKDIKGKVLVTNRRWDEGGACIDDDMARVKRLEEAVSLGADFVDIEASTDLSLIMNLKAAIKSTSLNPPTFATEALLQEQGAPFRTKLILSWHDFDGTPSDRVLKKKLRDMMAMGADIIKIVTYARAEADNLRVLSLIPYARRQGQEIIAFCMGGIGRPSRVMSPFLGSYLTYATLEKGTESAPGQLTVDEMKQIWDILIS